MDQYELIRTAYYRYKKSIHQIAKEYGHHRQTIRRALKGTEPGYQRQKPVLNSVMDSVAAIVDQWLEEDRKRPKKQRHTAQRVYDRLVSEYDFKGAASTVRRWVRTRKAELGIDSKEAMLPLCPAMGKEAEVDWGTARAYYTYDARFCNRGQGHEKGGVEGLVGYARRNFMVPLPQVTDLEELNHLLLSGCEHHSQRIRHHDGRSETIQTFWEAERKQLIRLPKKSLQ